MVKKLPDPEFYVEASDPESRVPVPPVSGHFSPFLCLPTLPWSLLSSTPANK